MSCPDLCNSMDSPTESFNCNKYIVALYALQMWVWAHRECTDMFETNTNNGVESMHRVLKHSYITKTGVRSLAELVTILTERYLPDMQRWYVSRVPRP